MIGIENPQPTVTVQIYPNPATDYCRYQLSEGSGETSIQLLNAMGQVVFTEIIHQTDGQLSLANLPTGLYCLRFAPTNAAQRPTVVKLLVQ